MNVLILGVGDAFTRKSFGSSALVRTRSGYTLIDCPDPIHRVLHEATTKAGWNVDALGISDIILTHLHGDHCNGLESFAFHHRMHRRSNPGLAKPRLHVTEPVAERVWERLAPAMDSPIGSDCPSTIDDYFELHTISPDKRATINGLLVECRFTKHPVPTIGLKIQAAENSSDAPARTIGFSGDTPFEQQHIDWLSDAALIIHECNRGAAHTHIEELNAQPDDLRRKMMLIHLPDDFDASCTDMRVLKEGDVLEV